MKTARIRVAEPTAEELCPAVASVGGTPGTLHFRRKYLISSLFFVILGTSKVRTSFLRSTPDSSFKFPTSPCRYVATSLFPRMLPFPSQLPVITIFTSQVPAFTIFTPKKFPASILPSFSSFPSMPRSVNKSTQVPATANSDHLFCFNTPVAPAAGILHFRRKSLISSCVREALKRLSVHSFLVTKRSENNSGAFCTSCWSVPPTPCHHVTMSPRRFFSSIVRPCS